jgi:uncharacterized protein (DUF1697 family)
MSTYIALLRAVNVGGTGKLPMADLKAMCVELGFGKVQTYIASGNVVLQSKLSEAKVKAALEARLQAYAGKPVGVLVRSGAQMAAVLANNRTVAIFLDAAPGAQAMEGIAGRNDEEIALGEREYYVHYGEGMGTSKLRIPAAKLGTARNIHTVAKLVEMAGQV